jgi:hypothetical protein
MVDGVDRRTLLLAGGGALIAAALGLDISRAEQAPAARDILVIDPRLDLKAVRAAMLSTPARVITLTTDPVRQWREGLSVEIAASGMAACAITRWDSALVLTGLAREHGISTTLDAKGAGVFLVVFGRKETA